jgi:thiamine-phosphate pyrophosphorylase
MSPPRILALTPGDLAPGESRGILATIGRALEAGLPGLLLREPRWSDRELLELARELRSACDGAGAWLAVHDRAHVALAAGADAVHLGFRSLAPALLRGVLGERVALGLSTHTGDDPDTWRAADYLVHGPLRATPSKQAGTPAWREPIGLDGLRDTCESTETPVLAIGGVRPEDVGPALDAGAHGVAVLSGILAAADPAAATRAYVEALPA